MKDASHLPPDVYLHPTKLQTAAATLLLLCVDRLETRRPADMMKQQRLGFPCSLLLLLLQFIEQRRLDLNPLLRGRKKRGGGSLLVRIVAKVAQSKHLYYRLHSSIDSPDVCVYTHTPSKCVLCVCIQDKSCEPSFQFFKGPAEYTVNATCESRFFPY